VVRDGGPVMSPQEGNPVIHLLVLADPISREYITLGGQIIIAILGAFGIVAAAYVTAVLGPRLRDARDSAAAAKTEAEEARAEQNAEREEFRQMIDAVLHQVRNSHGTNLRDDLDVMRAETAGGFKILHHRLDGLTDRFDRHIDRS
jgi:hypothetical protein